MLTIAKLHGESVAYYESTVGNELGQTASESGPDSYYSEDGTKPARAWIAARSRAQSERVSVRLGVEIGAEIRGDSVRDWFNKAARTKRGETWACAKIDRCAGVRFNVLCPEKCVCFVGVRK